MKRSSNQFIAVVYVQLLIFGASLYERLKNYKYIVYGMLFSFSLV